MTEVAQQPAAAETAASNAARREPEVVVLRWNATQRWPEGSRSDWMLIYGLVVTPVLLGIFLGTTFSVMYWPGHLFATAALLGAAVLGWRALRRRMLARPYHGPFPTGEEARIRLASPSERLAKKTEEFADEAFEPVVVRLLVDPWFGPLDERGGPMPSADAAKKRGRHEIASADRVSSRGDAWTTLICWVLAFATAIVMTRMATGNWWRGLRQEVIWAAMALGTLMSAFARPVYIRLAPGQVDAVLYPPLGAGTPRVLRYNLRTARVSVDEKNGWIGVFDASRAERGAMYLRPRWALTREHLGALIVNAARSTHLTPPLPMDDLIG